LYTIALVSSTFTGCSSGDSASSTQAAQPVVSTIAQKPATATTRSPEQDLAIIDGNGKPIAGSEKVFASLLDRAEPKCTEGRRGVADLSVKAVEVAKSNGARTNNFDMLTGALKILDLYEKPQECFGIFVAIATSISK
jgi:hypothetical protein